MIVSNLIVNDFQNDHKLLRFLEIALMWVETKLNLVQIWLRTRSILFMAHTVDSAPCEC